jgi:hypothetical protein
MPVTPDGSAQRRMADKPYRYKAPNERECAEDCDRHHHFQRPLVREYRRIDTGIVRSVRDCDRRYLENSAGGCLPSSLAPAQVQQLPYSDDDGRDAEQADVRWRERESRKSRRQAYRHNGCDPQDLPPDDAAAREASIGEETD